ncbi:AraC family transcriptional regulator [Kosakonia pseudosacchari]|uniref:AraC family transcriptional regulator n=1 Tax=Kosakonia pseudosacchari TaxID=1646340 RepID=A0ABX4ILZ3_9ENTR|nr:AraC family transcriptional regulator [Kosakonia pseudosacchari]PDO84956.1 AraC family transcriptional regulator [Kosakonia pseudosacchari]QOV64643.1 helix-turn-helix transcriptional regulator [Kosakonia pseudosacchari]WBU48796.1 helix-turn-helix transcriptional regulator [Kosakonia pseudosacchari]
MQKRHFSIEDFIGFGERYGIDYRFPSLATGLFSKAQRIVIQGDVEEMTLSSGINLTRSDIRVLQPYETTSLHSCPLYMLVVLEGSVMLRLNGEAFVVRSGMAFTSRLSEHQVMNASHLADCHLRTLSLGVDPASCWQSPLLSALLQQWEAHGAPTFLWQVPGFLLSGLQQTQQASLPALSRQLMLEGVMLQLLGNALSQRLQGQESRRTAPCGAQQRLENVRRLLEQHPEKEYTLAALAQLAAMSASSLRVKFRQAYGHSVFDYLRDCRLELARRYLAEGYSVQQAAWMSGYQHATNFSTAFRRRYGMAPSEIRAS